MSQYPVDPLRDLPPWDPEEEDGKVRHIRKLDDRKQRAALASLTKQGGEGHRRAYLRVQRNGGN
jgi:hypothetical protein